MLALRSGLWSKSLRNDTGGGAAEDLAQPHPFTAVPKESLQQLRAAASENATPHFHPMVELGMINDLQHGTDRSCLRVICTVN